jgi:hypothetical protein
MLKWLSENAVALGMLGAACGFLWSAIQVVLERRRDLHFKEFEAYHRLIKELVAPDPDSGSTWIDRQAAVVFELRNFPRYYEYTLRMLSGLKEKWSSDATFKWPGLIAEIDLTLSHIETSNPNKALKRMGHKSSPSIS